MISFHQRVTDRRNNSPGLQDQAPLMPAKMRQGRDSGVNIIGQRQPGQRLV